LYHRNRVLPPLNDPIWIFVGDPRIESFSRLYYKLPSGLMANDFAPNLHLFKNNFPKPPRKNKIFSVSVFVINLYIYIYIYIYIYALSIVLRDPKIYSCCGKKGCLIKRCNRVACSNVSGYAEICPVRCDAVYHRSKLRPFLSKLLPPFLNC
jgi:hypothetical protein